MEGAALAVVVGPLDTELAVLLPDRDPCGDVLGERAHRPGHDGAAVLDADLDPRGDLDGKLADARHAAPLPDVGQDLATDAGLVGVAVGHESLGGRDDGDAEAAEDPRQRLLLGVDAQAGL